MAIGGRDAGDVSPSSSCETILGVFPIVASSLPSVRDSVGMSMNILRRLEYNR